MEAIEPGGSPMAAPPRYPEELRERSLRLTVTSRGTGESAGPANPTGYITTP